MKLIKIYNFLIMTSITMTLLLVAYATNDFFQIKNTLKDMYLN